MNAQMNAACSLPAPEIGSTEQSLDCLSEQRGRMIDRAKHAMEMADNHLADAQMWRAEADRLHESLNSLDGAIAALAPPPAAPAIQSVSNSPRRVPTYPPSVQR